MGETKRREASDVLFDRLPLLSKLEWRAANPAAAAERDKVMKDKALRDLIERVRVLEVRMAAKEPVGPAIRLSPAMLKEKQVYGSSWPNNGLFCHNSKGLGIAGFHDDKDGKGLKLVTQSRCLLDEAASLRDFLCECLGPPTDMTEAEGWG